VAMRDHSDAISAIDAAVARLLAEVEALRSARAILAGLADPSTRPAQPSHPVQPSQSQVQSPDPPAKRGRGLSRSTLELREQLRKLLGEGVLDVRELSRRLGRPATSVYQGLSNAGLSLRKAREQWESGKGVVERGPDPVPPTPGEVVPGTRQVAGLEIDGVVFVREGQPPRTTYLRCTVATLPGESGEFTVIGHDGREITLEVGDAVAPFRDGTPTFRVGVVGGGEESPGAGEPDPEGEEGSGVLSGEPASDPRVAPLGTSPDSPREGRPATVPELRAEVVRRQRGCSGKAVRFATSPADGHSHSASVDRMGYGTTVRDASGHEHRVLRWEVLPAAGDAKHPARHVLTLDPLPSEPAIPRGGQGNRVK